MWLRSRLFWKIVSRYLLLTTFAFGLLAAGFGNAMTQSVESLLEDRMIREVRALKSAVVDCQTARQVADSLSGPSICNAGPVYIVRQSDSAAEADNEFEVQQVVQSRSQQLQPNRAVRPNLRGRLWRLSLQERVAVVRDPMHPNVVFGGSRLPELATNAVLVVRMDESDLLKNSAGNRRQLMLALSIAWLVVSAVVLILAAIYGNPVLSLVSVAVSADDSLQRRDTLIRLRDRHDELGSSAVQIEERDQRRGRKIKDLSMQQQDARESFRQLSTILQSMVEGVIAVEDDQRVVYANQAACVLNDLNPEAVENRLLFECVRSTIVTDAVAEALNSRGTVQVEYKLTRRELTLDLVVSPLPKGGAVLVMNDVSEVRRLEAIRKDFFNGVSHELKTPLTVIKACTETLLGGALQDEANARRFLKKIDAQSDRLHQLIVGMLHLARVESGQQVFMTEAVDLAAMARELLFQLQPIADTHSITIRYDGPDEVYVLGDQAAIRTVVNNLIDNALKYTGENGEVIVQVREEKRANTVAVRDNGPGISRDDQARIFERFYRVEKDRNRSRGGTGLGLAIVKHLCHALGAEVSVESEQGAGCRFVVSFPIHESDESVTSAFTDLDQSGESRLQASRSESNASETA